jgi:CRP-like cAMP-binding protein
MSREDIADYLGTSSETVIRAFTRLHGNGVLDRVRPRELKLDLAKLRKYIDGV